MGTSLLASDYKRFADDLKDQDNANIIADFIMEWRLTNKASNPSFLDFLLTAIIESYPIFGLEADSETIELYDLDAYQEYDYPSLEFACDFIVYTLERERKKGADDKHVKDKLSFKIDKRHRTSLLALTKKLNVTIDFLRERNGADVAELFADIMTADDLSGLDKNHFSVYFSCQTRYVVYVFNNIKESYNPTNLETVIDKSGIFFSKQGIPLSRTLLYKEKNKLKTADTLEYRSLINKIFHECHPDNF
ncbi:MAG: hypothetical protein BGO55_24055 [Sphingobacteriales bacterium 50-39]|nr:hypothetical protein [Sphingobacteriales bacterium]OJW58373.1 MAG: hypothetical protein BGO55_24055 [Sphingobacteriales bacterium 50-39]